VVRILPEDPDPAFHFDADPNPDPTFHFNADPDPDPSFQIKAQYLENVLILHLQIDADPDAGPCRPRSATQVKTKGF
jgi:hypothetical protein